MPLTVSVWVKVKPPGPVSVNTIFPVGLDPSREGRTVAERDAGCRKGNVRTSSSCKSWVGGHDIPFRSPKTPGVRRVQSLSPPIDADVRGVCAH